MSIQQIICDCCEGAGDLLCNHCSGNGTRYPELHRAARCPQCAGTGIVQCPKCWGEGSVNAEMEEKEGSEAGK